MSTCGLCGNEATGLASITVGGVETRYCHGDDDAEPTCYEKAQWLNPLNVRAVEDTEFRLPWLDGLEQL